MWKKVPDELVDSLLEKAIVFTGDARLYGSFMMRAITEWPVSCEHNLLDYSLNRQAWIGHAAVCIALQCPEYITRKAWWYLKQEQQDAANLEADAAISAWELDYASKIENAFGGQLCLSL